MSYVMHLNTDLTLVLAGYLSTSHVVHLLRTCQHFYSILEKYPWQFINFHGVWDHGRKERGSSKQPCIEHGVYDDEFCKGEEHRRANECKITQFLETCALLKLTKPSSWTRYSAAVRTLHINLSEHTKEWAIVLSFTGLLKLCINGNCRSSNVVDKRVGRIG
jgi:hypothetical protein